MAQVKRQEIEKFINQLLSVYEYQDYCPNGLQVEGKENIKKIAFCVSATQETISFAIEKKCDLIITHHGIIWNYHQGKTITKEYYKRIAPLIKNDISLLAYHLPLDGDLKNGHAALLAKKLQFLKIMPFGDYKGKTVGVMGQLKKEQTVFKFKQKLQEIIGHPITIATDDEEKKIKSIGIITGAARDGWKDAKKKHLDAFISGETSEHDWSDSIEAGITTFSCGHIATETFGIINLMKLIEKKFKVECIFIKSSNPI